MTGTDQTAAPTTAAFFMKSRRDDPLPEAAGKPSLPTSAEEVLTTPEGGGASSTLVVERCARGVEPVAARLAQRSIQPPMGTPFHVARSPARL